jgi:hypothetical protein
MAQEIQMDEAVLSRIINGFRKPSSEQRRVIASYLGAEEEWLFAHDEQLLPIPKASDKNRHANSKTASAGSQDGLAGEGSN